MVSVIPLCISFVLACGNLGRAWRRWRGRHEPEVLERTVLKVSIKTFQTRLFSTRKPFVQVDALAFLVTLSLWTFLALGVHRLFFAVNFYVNAAHGLEAPSWTVWIFQLLPHLYPVSLYMLSPLPAGGLFCQASMAGSRLRDSVSSNPGLALKLIQTTYSATFLPKRNVNTEIERSH